MNGKVVDVGIDVDDVQYHGSALDRQTGEVLSFQCGPNLNGLIGQLDNVRKHFGGVELKLCYEASYVGFSLQRDLASHPDCRAPLIWIDALHHASFLPVRRLQLVTNVAIGGRTAQSAHASAAAIPRDSPAHMMLTTKQMARDEFDWQGR